MRNIISIRAWAVTIDYMRNIISVSSELLSDYMRNIISVSSELEQL